MWIMPGRSRQSKVRRPGIKQKDDRYRSSYNHYGIAESLLWPFRYDGALKSISLDAALAYEQSRIDQDAL